MTNFDEGRRDEFVGRLFGNTVAAVELLSVYLGDRLGLYGQLQAGGPATSTELAERASIHERYAREWLEQQAVAGLLEVETPSEDPLARRYRLPAEHAEPLLDETSLNYFAPFARMMGAATRPLDALVDAYHSGGGVGWAAFGVDAREGQAAANRPVYERLLVGEWLDTIPDVRARLDEHPSLIADIACGGGWSSIALARRFPLASVDGYDLDEASVALARRNAEGAGLADRVKFHHQDASGADLGGRYDLVTVFEALHGGMTGSCGSVAGERARRTFLLEAKKRLAWVRQQGRHADAKCSDRRRSPSGAECGAGRDRQEGRQVDAGGGARSGGRRLRGGAHRAGR